jgi:pyrimidine operon attenuation protein/uracil phosphoribosyltransferase
VKQLTSAAGSSQGASTPSGGSEVREASSAGALMLDAEALYRELLRGAQLICNANTRFVGIISGGAWLAERLQQDMQLPGPAGKISSAMHRDDFAQRGLSSGGQTVLPFDVNGADILILDDVLYTGRTLRAVINELFDYGRPASVKLAVLVDRGGRELPVQADFAAARVSLAGNQSLTLARSEAGVFSFNVKEV